MKALELLLIEYGKSHLKVFSHWQLPILLIAVIVFVISWILQFIGHKIEGKKPSFLKDLQFLLIGPLWVFVGNNFVRWF